MALSLKHAFASAKADGVDPTLVQPSNWNAEHTITMATGKVLGRASAGAGAVEELATTGTGNVVMSASPTFTGTAAFAALSTTGNASFGGTLGVTGTLSGTTGNFSGAVTASSMNVNGSIVGIGSLEAAAGAAGSAAIVAYFNGSSGRALHCQVQDVGADLVSFYFGGGKVGSITTNSTNTAYNTSSDARLKENIADAGDAGAIIDALQVRQWDWKSNGTHEAFGFVAQEEYGVYAPAVTAGDTDPDTIERQWARDDSKLVPLLVKEIQSLRARIAALEAKVP